MECGGGWGDGASYEEGATAELPFTAFPTPCFLLVVVTLPCLPPVMTPSLGVHPHLLRGQPADVATQRAGADGGEAVEVGL